MYRQLLDPFRQGVPVGSAFVFTNRAANRVKVPDWGGRGLNLWHQRLEVGRLELTATQFTMILDGFDPLTARRR